VVDAKRGELFAMAGEKRLGVSAGIAAPSFWKVGRTWGAAITTAPYATSAAAVARGARWPQGSVFSANTMSVITAMAATPALTDLLSGQVQVMFATLPSSIEHIRAGKLWPLAVTTATRSERLPDIPTVDEFVPGYEASQWYGVGAPKNTPPQTIHKLNKEINATLDDPKMKAHLADLGGTVLAGSPADFGKMIAEETEKWGKVIRVANIKPE
jgi:tripartite-type tricarboxylate transporter receptor subunit TctC